MGQYTPAHYYEGRNADLRLIVIHTMEAPEGPQTAENIAAYFASGAVVASAHACVDQDSVVVCLPPTATAFAAPGANADGYQIEHAGYASQDGEGWNDAESQSMLKLSAAHAREIALAAGIPLKHLTNAELAAGEAGFVGHNQVSDVYKRSDHWDPGPQFPWSQYMALVNNGEAETESTPIVPEEDTVKFIRSRQTGTIYAITPTDVVAMTSAKVWTDMVKAYGLANAYEVSLDDGDIAGIAADAAARRARLVAEVAATVGAIDPAKLAESLAPAIVPPPLSAHSASTRGGASSAMRLGTRPSPASSLPTWHSRHAAPSSSSREQFWQVRQATRSSSSRTGTSVWGSMQISQSSSRASSVLVWHSRVLSKEIPTTRARHRRDSGRTSSDRRRTCSRRMSC